MALSKQMLTFSISGTGFQLIERLLQQRHRLTWDLILRSVASFEYYEYVMQYRISLTLVMRFKS